MLTSERRADIAERIERDGSVIAKELATQYGTSEDTIRRDLRELAAAGRCRQVYGGAVRVRASEPDYAARATVEPEAKRRVAVAAASLVRPGMTVIIDGGTTALALVLALPRDLRCSVVTHSPTIAVALADHPDIDVQLIGGRLMRHSMVMGGAAAAEAAAGISADLCFLGVSGVTADRGLTTADADDAAMKRALARGCREVHVLASSEKLGAVTPHPVLPLDEVSSLITDAPTGGATVGQLRAAGLTIFHAGA